MRLKNYAAESLNTSTQFLTEFEESDPLNVGNTLKGFINRKKGSTGGSLVITHVNGTELPEPEVIWGTPKLAYPYKANTDHEYINFSGVKKALLFEKYNGVNILFYKYHDTQGNVFVTAKTKGTAVIKDGDYGRFLSLTKEALDRDNSPIKAVKAFSYNQSASYELCGSKEPHLVKYDFELELKPLFHTRYSGKIKPIGAGINVSNGITDWCVYYQFIDFAVNEFYRQSNGLPLKYEYDHFSTEGKVLYLLDEAGYVIDRTMYKVKPKDIEEVHWATFEKNYQARINEALKKISMEGGLPLEDEDRISLLSSELDMGPKEWSKWGRKILRYVEGTETKHNNIMIVLCGLPGSGKSTYALKLQHEKGFVRVNQDELGSRNKCKQAVCDALAQGKNVIVDRCNFDVNQRASWIRLGELHGVKELKCLILPTPPDECARRAKAREDHPTIKPGMNAEKIIREMYEKYVHPSLDEGFDSIEVLSE